MRGLLFAGVSAAAIISAPAWAEGADPQQEPAPPPQTAQTGTATTDASDFIIVTGSRIARPNIDASVPVTTLSADEVTMTGEVSLGDTLNLLPAFNATFGIQNSGRFIGTAGLNTLDLRGQGTARTLVLVNGRRHVSSQVGSSTVDVNLIATDLVERIDVVTGGNSAIYGSDAVAGVVNFITRRDFDGFRIRAQTGISSRGDRPTFLVSATAGKNFNEGRGNIAANFEYTQADPLFFTDRDSFAGGWSGRSQLQLTQNTLGEPPEGDGIPDTTFLRRIRNLNISTGGLYTSACTGSPERRALNCTGLFNQAGTAELGKTFVFLPDGTLIANPVEQDFRPFGSSNSQGGLGSTLRETGLLQVGVKRYVGTMLASYEFSDAARVFFEGKYAKVRAFQEGQPTFHNNPFRLDNPFLTDQARAVLQQSLAPGATQFSAFRFNTDFGGRGEDQVRDIYRIVGGIQGTFNDTWRYEVALNYGRYDGFYDTRGITNQTRFFRARDAALNAEGQIVCRVNLVTVTDPACVPVNLFGLGAPSQAALDYFVAQVERKQFNDQWNAIAYMSGDLGKWFQLPGGPIAFSVGGEWRQERSFEQYDELSKAGELFFNVFEDFDPPRLTVWEGFAEIRIPLLADRPGFQELTFEGATRVSNYNVGSTGTVWAFNAGGIWAPVRDLRLRAGWARAVRAPTTGNLFQANVETFLNGLVDPCGQQNIDQRPERRANCAAAGVPTTQTFVVDGVAITEPFTNRPASGISGVSGGNPDLVEERSDNITIGGVFQPRFAPGLVLTVDYYDIKIKDVINTIGSQTIINQCYDSTTGIDNQFCRAVFRRPDGTFAGQSNVIHAGETITLPTIGPSFRQGPFNYASQRTTGIDFDLAYTVPMRSDDWRLNGRLILAYLIRRDLFTNIDDPDFRTRVMSTLGNPRWAFNGRINIGYREFDLNYAVRFVDRMTVGAWNTQNSIDGRPPTNADAFPFIYYPSVSYHDLRGSVRLGQHRIYAGVDNIFDRLPPFDNLGTGAGDAIYSNTGRFFYFGADLRF
ncbi:MAG: TonB-dependent receptor domain-containing protein [Thermaurantiacus sp.]